MLEIRQCQMRLVRLRVPIDQIVLIIVEKDFRMLHKKSVRKDLLRCVAVGLFRVIQALFRAKIRNIAFGRNPCAAKEYDILTAVQDLFQLFVHAVPSCFLYFSVSLCDLPAKQHKINISFSC